MAERKDDSRFDASRPLGYLDREEEISPQRQTFPMLLNTRQ